jgi:hypothetical protein
MKHQKRRQKDTLRVDILPYILRSLSDTFHLRPVETEEIKKMKSSDESNSERIPTWSPDFDICN